MISVLGLGGAGGNIANKASLSGIEAGAINFSQKDLDSAENVKYKLKILGSEGVGHNRDEAIRLIQIHYEMVIDFIKEHFNNPSSNIIIIPFATGGGSGSGTAPILIDILSNVLENKVIVAFPIIPDISESPVSQMNFLATFEELSKLDISIFPVDNQKVKQMNPNVGKNVLYEVTNDNVINLIQKIASYTQKFSKNGNFDKRDFLTVLSTKGIGIISETDITSIGNSVNLTEEGVIANIHKSWDNSIFAPIEYEYVTKAGVIFDGQESIMQYLNHEKLFSEKFENGMPLDLFEGYYHENKGKILTIMSGLPWCKSRLNQVEKILPENEKKMEVVLSGSDNQRYESSASHIANRIRKPQEKKAENLMDVLNKYKNR
jgi:cell division GTPase FtsZ